MASFRGDDLPVCRSRQAPGSRASTLLNAALLGLAANAVGAAIAQISGEVDQIFHDLTREDAIARAREGAEQKAVAAGADPASLKVVEVEDLPLSYLPGNALRTRVRVVGDVAAGSRG